MVGLLVFEWFDGPLCAVALGADNQSYLAVHVGNPPITQHSVFEVWPLEADAYQRLRSAAAAEFGAHQQAVWVLPPSTAGGNADGVDAAYMKACETQSARTGYLQADELNGRDHEIVWIPTMRVHEVADLTGDQLWQAVHRIAQDDAD